MGRGSLFARFQIKLQLWLVEFLRKLESMKTKTWAKASKFFESSGQAFAQKSISEKEKPHRFWDGEIKHLIEKNNR